ARGGLAPWAERRCLELLRERLSEDISLDELAAEARLSPFHFARMFKQSVGVPPRVYLTRLRMEKASELLEQTDLTVTEIAQEVGHSSNQVLARVFVKHRHMSPSDYRRVARDPVRRIARQSISMPPPDVPVSRRRVSRARASAARPQRPRSECCLPGGLPAPGYCHSKTRSRSQQNSRFDPTQARLGS